MRMFYILIIYFYRYSSAYNQLHRTFFRKLDNPSGLTIVYRFLVESDINYFIQTNVIDILNVLANDCYKISEIP